MSRVKESLGKIYVNQGRQKNQLDESRFDATKVRHRNFFLLDIIPMGAVRMTRRDSMFLNPDHIDPKKRQRISVTRYFEFKNRTKAQCQEVGYQLGRHLDVIFFVPIPDSKSEKKKAQMNGMPCTTKPDIDNYVKGFMDAIASEDGFVWKITAEKRWAYNGSILIYE